MVNKSLVVFALKEEFDPWKRRHGFRLLLEFPFPVSIASIGATQVYATLVGAGARTIDQIDELTTRIRPSFAIATGVAAGLKSNLQFGEVVVADTVNGLTQERGIPSSPELLRKAVNCGARLVSAFLTVPRIVQTVEEKTRLGLDADVADMESWPLMELWSTQGVPALSLRVILDSADTPMSFDFESAMNNDGQMEKTKILGQILRSPKLLPGLIRLAKQNRTALRNLADFLDRFFET